MTKGYINEIERKLNNYIELPLILATRDSINLVESKCGIKLPTLEKAKEITDYLKVKYFI